MGHFKDTDNSSSELSVEIIIRGVLTLEQSQAKKTLASIQKGLENLVAQNQISSSVVKEFRQMKAKIRKKEKKMKVYCWDGKDSDYFFIRGVGYQAWLGLGEVMQCKGLEAKGEYGFGDFGQIHIFDSEKVDGDFLDSVDLLKFVSEHSGPECAIQLLSDENIGWIWIDALNHLRVKEQYEVPLTEDENIWKELADSQNLWSKYESAMGSQWLDWRPRLSHRYEGNPDFRKAIDREIFNLVSKKAEFLDEALLETGEKVVVLSMEVPCEMVDIFDGITVRKGQFGPFRVIPWGKHRRAKCGEPGITCDKEVPCQEDYGIGIPETNNPTPFMEDEAKGKYYLAYNSSLYYKTRIEKNGELAFCRETFQYGNEVFIFAVGSNLPDFRNRVNADKKQEISVADLLRGNYR